MENMLTLNQVSERTGIKYITIVKMCNEKRIPGATKFGDVWAVPVESLPLIALRKAGRPRRKPVLS